MGGFGGEREGEKKEREVVGRRDGVRVIAAGDRVLKCISEHVLQRGPAARRRWRCPGLACMILVLNICASLAALFSVLKPDWSESVDFFSFFLLS